jgi:hypothetical protein
MGQKFIITESERNQIRGLYEQSTPQSGTTTQPSQPQIQGTFQYSAQGLNPYVIVNVNGMNSEQIFNNTLNWVKETFSNPDKVIKMTIPNQKIRIEISSNIGQVKNVKFPLLMNIEISFKDGKLKFEPIDARNPQSDPSQDINFIQFPGNIPEDGIKMGGFKFKKEKIIENMSQSTQNLQLYLNNLIKNLTDYFTKKKDDW